MQIKNLAWRVLWLSVITAGFLMAVFFLTKKYSSQTAPMPMVYVQDSRCETVFVDLPEPLSVRCYTIQTRAGGLFQLPLAVISRGKSRQALLHIAGGPGEGLQTTAESIEFWLEWYLHNHVQADLIVYSPRGTAGARPHFWCEKYEQPALESLLTNQSLAEELAAAAAVIEGCLESLQQLHGGQNLQKQQALQVFSSRYQADDALHILEQLGYEEWHIYGASYGSRVAMLAAQQAAHAGPSRLSSIILDSPYPPGKGGLAEWSELSEYSFRLHEQNHPGFRELWQNIAGFLASRQPVYRLENWNYDLEPCPYKQKKCIEHVAALPVKFTLDRMLGLIYFVLYDETLLSDFYAGMTALLEELKRGQYEQTNPELQLVMEAWLANAFTSSFNSLVYIATECVDNGVDSVQQIAEANQQYPHWATYLNTLAEFDICRDTRFFNQSMVLTEPAEKLQLPVWVLVGELDPVTPAYWGEEIQRAHSAVLDIAEGTGHGVLYYDYCAPGAVQQWLDNPGTAVCGHESSVF